MLKLPFATLDTSHLLGFIRWISKISTSLFLNSSTVSFFMWPVASNRSLKFIPVTIVFPFEQITLLLLLLIFLISINFNIGTDLQVEWSYTYFPRPVANGSFPVLSDLSLTVNGKFSIPNSLNLSSKLTAYWISSNKSTLIFPFFTGTFNSSNWLVRITLPAPGYSADP